MTNTEKRYAVFYKSDIVRGSKDGQMDIFTHKKYAEARIWNHVTVFRLSKQELTSKKITDTEIVKLNRKLAKKYRVVPIIITY